LSPGPYDLRLSLEGYREVEQIVTIDASQTATVQHADSRSALARLVQLKSVATTSASVLLDEGVVWRAFQNRRQIGGSDTAVASLDNLRSTAGIGNGLKRGRFVRLHINAPARLNKFIRCIVPMKMPGGWLTAGQLVQFCCPGWTGSAFRIRRARWLRRRRMRDRR
jgi:hypothetical protein